LKEIKKLDGVLDIHHIHLWTLDGNKNYITIHALIDKKLSVSKIIALKKTIKDALKKQNISHCVIEFEREDEKCSEGNFCG
jgi:cobalt-zinc-cadmium efflux system protein